SLIVAVMADRVTGTSRHYAHLYREASDRLLTAQEVERRRLSRDLHDGVGQTLTALLFTLDATESSQWSGSAAPALTTNGIHRAQELAAIALEETRDVATRLRPTRIVEAGVCASIVELAQRTSPAITVDVPPDLIRTGLLPQDAEIDLFRIVQEALANATRHAKARHIGVSISRTGDDLRVEISDDGVGFGLPTAKDEGLGLAGMRERADSIRGRLSITSGASGSTVAIVVALATDPRPRLDPSTSAAQPVSAHEVRT
ncbi:MAG: sensor histidine kinase, partial [Chloroflexota bacterium]